MFVALKVIVALSVAWAAIALALQVRAARGEGRMEHSRRAGSPVRGIGYSFSVAMTPRHKESVRRHPFKFVTGVLMHVGIVTSLVAVLLLLVWPPLARAVLSLSRPLVALALAAALVLLVRRPLAPDLKAMSVPDDYLASLATGGLLALALLHSLGAVVDVVLLSYAALFFVYLPLGKLRHAAFFFAARGDYGRRLGYRGVYPPAATGPR